MGHGIMGKDIVPFKSDMFIYEGGNLDSDELQFLFEPEGYVEDCNDNGDTPIGDHSDPEHPSLNGWVSDVSDFGKKKKVFAPEWSKGDFRVWLLNESDANSGGWYEVSICANDEASIHEFLKDFIHLFPNPVTIAKDEIVVQWG